MFNNYTQPTTMYGTLPAQINSQTTPVANGVPIASLPDPVITQSGTMSNEDEYLSESLYSDGFNLCISSCRQKFSASSQATGMPSQWTPTSIRNDAKTGSKRKHKQLTEGIADVECIVDYRLKGTRIQKIKLRVRISPDKPAIYTEVNFEDITADNRQLRKELEALGIIFKTPPAFRCLVIYLRQQLRTHIETRTIYNGIFEADGKLMHSDEETIFREGVEGLDLLYDAADNLSDFYPSLTIASMVALTEFSDRLTDPPLPVVIFKSPSPATDAAELAKTLEMPLFTHLDLGTAEKLSPQANVLDISSTSEHMLNAHLAHTVGKQASCPMFLFVKDTTQVADIIDPTKYVTIELNEPVDTKTVRKLRSILLAVLLYSPDRVLELTNRDRYPEFEEFSDYIHPFVFRLCCCFNFLVCAVYRDSNKGNGESENYVQYLIETIDASSTLSTDSIRSYLESHPALIHIESMTSAQKTKDTIAVDRNRIILTTPAFRKMAAHLKLPAVRLATCMKMENFLIADGKFQRNVRLSDGVVPLYVIDQGTLYSSGSLRLGYCEFIERKPEIMIGIGKCGDKPVNIALRDTVGTDNSNVYITGASGSGKTHLIRYIAVNGAVIGLPVVFVTTSFPKEAVEGAEIIEFSASRTSLSDIFRKGKIVYIVVHEDDGDDDEEPASDRAIREIFEYKRDINSSPCLLILDEVQDFDLSQKKPLAKLVLRQGRQYGLITILASQYLTAEDAGNIKHLIRQCETHIVFKPENDAQTRKRLGIKKEDTAWCDYLSEVPRYSFAAYGHLATDRGYIDYPIVARVPAEKQ